MSAPVLVKICGTTNREDLELAAHSGADFVGVIAEFPRSPRNVSMQVARTLRNEAYEANIGFVLVTVNLSLEQLEALRQELQPDVLQLHGDESPELVRQLKSKGAIVWTAVHVAARADAMLQAGADALLVDARTTSADGNIYGGTGQRSDWQLARDLISAGARVILAGGLAPDNVGDAIREVQPWAVDAISGVEASKGIKDPTKVAGFIEVARSALV